jgi:hypothetical protein
METILIILLVLFLRGGGGWGFPLAQELAPANRFLLGN